MRSVFLLLKALEDFPNRPLRDCDIVLLLQDCLQSSLAVARLILQQFEQLNTCLRRCARKMMWPARLVNEALRIATRLSVPLEPFVKCLAAYAEALAYFLRAAGFVITDHPREPRMQ